MTREEAIKLLEHISIAYTPTDAYGDYDDPQPYEEAIDMAIEALKILGDDGIVNCCGCIHWKSDGGAMMVCDLLDIPMGDFDYCSFGERGDTE